MAIVSRRSMYIPRYRLQTEMLNDQWGGGSSRVREKAVQAVDDDQITLSNRASEHVLTEDPPAFPPRTLTL